MPEYWDAVKAKVGKAAGEVTAVAVISLAPLMLGRLVLLFGKPADAGPKEGYWDFLTNGQLAFYSMGTLASLLLICLSNNKLPDLWSKIIGMIAALILMFIGVLVGFDPTLKAGTFAFVGRGILAIYLLVLILKVFADAMKDVELPQALDAGERRSRKTAAALAKRKAT